MRRRNLNPRASIVARSSSVAVQFPPSIAADGIALPTIKLGSQGRFVDSRTEATASVFREIEELAEVRNETNLRAEIDALKSRVAALENAFEFVEELEWDDALTRARGYFLKHKGQSISPIDLAAILNTSYSQAADICEALEKEGAVVGR